MIPSCLTISISLAALAGHAICAEAKTKRGLRSPYHTMQNAKWHPARPFCFLFLFLYFFFYSLLFSWSYLLLFASKSYGIMRNEEAVSILLPVSANYSSYLEKKGGLVFG
jgi:hypothetical protein